MAFKLLLIILPSMFLLLISILFAYYPIFEYQFDKQFNSSYIELPEIIPLEGNLTPNLKLQNAVYLGHKKLHGPEAFVLDKNGLMYTGLMNGQVVRINLSDGSFDKIAQIGNPIDENICNDYGSFKHSRAECGRPLGLRIKNNSLYVADSYYGIVKIDLNTFEKKIILSSNDKRFGDKPLKLVNDLDLDGDLIYFIDSSYVRNINEAIEEHLESQPRGRLFKFNEKTNELELLRDGLYFPNGLQLTPNKDVLLINENSMSRIVKFYLSGEKSGQLELFANIPGYGDTIRLSDKNTLLVPFSNVRYSKYKSILDLIGKYPLIRNFFGKILNLRYLFLIFPKYGLFAEYDLNGNVLRSWHDPSGNVVECTTSGVIYNNKLYMGSFYNDFISVVDYN